MRLWLSKSSEVPLREQLVTQIRLGIISGDLVPRQKLPSTRELARRFRIHANTVSAAYRELYRRGWVEFRRGSGVYVRVYSGNETDHDREAGVGLDQLIASFFSASRAQGHSLAEIQTRLRRWLDLQPPDHFLLIEPDVELRHILVTEIHEATGVRVAAASLSDPHFAEMLTGAAPVAMYGQAESVRTRLPDFIILRSRSVVDSLLGETRPGDNTLIAIVSRWPEFLRWSRAILVAAGLDANALSFCDARELGWQRGLRSAKLIVTDSLMIRKLPPGCNTRCFAILSDSSLEELRQFAKQFMNQDGSAEVSTGSGGDRVPFDQ